MEVKAKAGRCFVEDLPTALRVVRGNAKANVLSVNRRDDCLCVEMGLSFGHGYPPKDWSTGCTCAQ